ncbi:MAG: DMT family transporter [Cypionkella sp.]|nr:DMT family transporter [Cypionkella sp.]
MDRMAIVMGVVFAMIWSSAFATARILMEGAPPFLTLTGRFALSGLIAVIIARALGQSWRIDRATGRSVIIFGLCQNGLYLGLNFLAMQKIEASLAAIIAASMPLIVALLASVFRGQRMGALGVAGMVTGFAGVAIVMGSRLSGGADPIMVLACIVGAAALAVATLTVGTVTKDGNLLMIVGLQMWVGAIALGIVSALIETPVVMHSAKIWAAFAYQLLIPGLAATLIWFALVGRIGAIKASTFHFLNPAFGVIIAAALLGEEIGVWDIVGVVIAAVGILAVQLSKLRQTAT